MGLFQVQFAEKLEQSQSFVTKVERYDRRLDLLQLLCVCLVLGTPSLL